MKKTKKPLSIKTKLRRMKCDPIKILAKFAMCEELDPAQRIKAAIELNTRVYPSLKAIEQKPDDDTREKLAELEELKQTMSVLLEQNQNEY